LPAGAAVCYNERSTDSVAVTAFAQGSSMKAHSLPIPSGRASGQRWFLLGLCLFFVAVNVQYVIKITRSDKVQASAINRWLEPIYKLGDGTNIWAENNYPNPPIMAIILKPLAQLPSLAAILAWFYLKVAMAVLAVHWVLTLLDRGEQPFPWWGKVLTVILCLRPIAGDLVHGNVNLFILFLVVAALVSFCHKRDVLAGLLLALAIACKLTPALFIPYFLWKRAWKMLAGTALGLVLFLWVIPGLFLGWSENQQYLETWYKNMVAPFAEGKVTSEAVNQSLPGLACRMLTHNPSIITYIDGVFTPVEYHNVLDMGEKTVQRIMTGCMGLFALTVLWRCRTPTDDRQSWRMLAEFSVVVLGMLLFSERTWKHHCVTLLLPFAVLAYCAFALRWSAWRRGYLIGTLAASFALMMLTSTGLTEGQDRLGDLAQVYGAYVWVFLLLLTALVVLLGSKPRDERSEPQGFDAPHPRESLRSSRGLPL
jgi:hypothetical protein